MKERCYMNPERVRGRMRELSLSQQDLASACEIEVRTLQRWLAGQRVTLKDAERAAAALRVGTAEVFDGVPVDAGLLRSSLNGVLRLVSVRESDFAQALRTVFKSYPEMVDAVSFESHPARGYVTRFPVLAPQHFRFQGYRVRVPEGSCSIRVRLQIGARFGYTIGTLRVQGRRVELLETFQCHSMLAELNDDHELDVFLWNSPDRREVLWLSEQPIKVVHSPLPGGDTFDLTSDASRHAVCFRPSNGDLRAAGLPQGFDRVIASRDPRLEAPLPR